MYRNACVVDLRDFEPDDLWSNFGVGGLCALAGVLNTTAFFVGDLNRGVVSMSSGAGLSANRGEGFFTGRSGFKEASCWEVGVEHVEVEGGGLEGVLVEVTLQASSSLSSSMSESSKASSFGAL